MSTHRFAAISLAVLAGAPAAMAKPPIEAFGDVPTVRSAELSPDGTKVAYLLRQNGEDGLVIHDLTTGQARGLARVGDMRARDVGFAGNNYVIAVTSRVASSIMVRGWHWEASDAYSINLSTGKSVRLLSDTQDLYPAQSGLGRIIAIDRDGKYVYMPAFIGPAIAEPSYDVMKVNLETGRGVRHRRGDESTRDWILDTAGEVVAREDFDETKSLHEIRVGHGSSSRAIYSQRSALPTTQLVGLSPAGDKLVTTDNNESAFISLYEMSQKDGAVSGPLMQRANVDVAESVLDRSRRVLGVRYAGLRPQYEMFDADINRAIQTVQVSLPGASVWLDSWSDDWSKMLFLVEGGKAPERYMLFDRKAERLLQIAAARPEIKAADVGHVDTIEYKTRDGLKIPALVTWPAGSTTDTRKKLPLVVMPHGGPQAYDHVGFDWLAQYLANEGYAVLQPNFRGSAGFGLAFMEAGHGQWGRKMQDDITDGVAALVDAGWADSSRVCIVGWSYGGYAALAGGALTPDLYKCVVSIAGVSDLRSMLDFEKRKGGSDSMRYVFWTRLIGDPERDTDAIDAVSPARLADRFKAPVLLIHGTEDTVVDENQSERMADALKAKGKNVSFIPIKGDDHGLVDNDSRRKALTEIGAFLARHIGQP